MGFLASYIQLYENGELEKRIATGYEILRDCNLCPRECGVNRLDGEKGVCRSGKNIMISSAGPHFGEERPLVGRHGSGTIFLTNCNLACIFCQNYDISHLGYGRDSNSEDLAKIMLGLQKMGCHNINFVTPTHYVPQILAALPIAVKDGLKIPLVYNCGGYESMNTIKLLEGVFDVYMPDIKYGNNSMAEKYSKAPKYFDFAVKAVTDMYRQVGDLVINSEGICEKGLLVRHLVLPDDIAKTKEVMEFLSMLSRNTYINIMEQYHPEYKAYQFPELNRRITHKEFENAISIARSFGLKRGFPDEPKRYL